MRKQYHLRNSPCGLLAWDVDRLIRLTADLPVIELPLGEIRELDEPYWYNHEGERPTCKSIAEHMRLVQAVDLACPVIICPQGRVMDGMHRVVKAWLKGLHTIQAYQLPVLPEPDYIGVDPDALPYDDS